MNSDTWKTRLAAGFFGLEILEWHASSLEKKMSQLLTIVNLAKKVDIGVETIRFYEWRGLIEQPQKPIEGYRVYPAETLNQIQFIKRARELGFTLDEITNLLALEIQTKCALPLFSGSETTVFSLTTIIRIFFERRQSITKTITKS